MSKEVKVTLHDLQMTDLEEAAYENDTMAEGNALLMQAAADAAAKKKKEYPDEEEGPQDPNALPKWVSFPDGFKIPPGKQVVFMRFRAHWTDKPQMGDRWCMLWNLSDADEKLAMARCRGDVLRSTSELAKQTIRLIDGVRADWTKTPGSGYDVDKFWSELGAKCRQQIVNYYARLHVLSREEQQDFFKNCIAVRTMGG